jgi:hypothetical protein
MRGGLTTLIMIVIFLLVEWSGRDQEYAIARLFTQRAQTARWSYYVLIAFAIFWFQGDKQEFIYFQF